MSQVPIVIFIAITLLSGVLFFVYTQPGLRDLAGTKESDPPPADETPVMQPTLQPTEPPPGQAATGGSAEPTLPARPGPTLSEEAHAAPEAPERVEILVGTPATILEAVAEGVLDGKIDEVFPRLGPEVVDADRLAQLRQLLGDGGYEIDPENAVREIGRTPDLQRWALNLRMPDDHAKTSRLEIDFARQGDGRWVAARLHLPGDEASARQLTPDAEALDTALTFLQAVQEQDFAVARRVIDQQRVTDATIAGLCIIFEEGAFRSKEERPLIATVARENVAWFLAQVTSDNLETESRFGLVLQRDAGEPWRITEINPERILAVYASRFGDGDIYYTPLVRNPKGGDSVVLYFGYDDDKIHPRTLRQIEIIAGALKADTGRKLRIWGHTDAMGSTDYNRKLSLARAEAVRDALVGHGVEEAQIEIAGFGASRPRRANFNPDGTDNPDGRKVNRRAEIYLDF